MEKGRDVINPAPADASHTNVSVQASQSGIHAVPAQALPNAFEASSSALGQAAPSQMTRSLSHERNPFSVAVLDRWLKDATRLREMSTRHPPQSLDELRVAYEHLGEATALSEAAMRSALDVLDVRNAGLRTLDAPNFQRVLQEAFASLRQCGTAFSGLSSDFSNLVHGPKSWPNRPVQLRADRGDGQPLMGYENTFKNAGPMSAQERQEAFQKRVDKYVDRGGDFDDIIVAKPGTFDSLPSGVHHDYVLLPNGTLRLFENANDDANGPPKPGHSLLATGSAHFQDAPVLLAGELWVLKDSAGDVEAVVIANNSGHYKPHFEDLENALPHLANLGIPAERVVLFGGPNNLEAIFREIGEQQPDAPRGHVVRMEDVLRRADASLMPSPLALRLSTG